MSNTTPIDNIKEGLLNELNEEDVDMFIVNVLDSYVPNFSRIKKSDLTPLSVHGREQDFSRHLRAAESPKDLDGFFELLKEAINDRLDRENVAPQDRVILTEDYPPIDLKSETISFRVIERSPGTLSQGKQMNQQIQDWRGRLREIVPDLEHPGKKLVIVGQLYDNLIELTCWARTNKAANSRTLWLENLIEEYTWFFKYKGLKQIRYQGRQQDSFQEINNNRLISRPMRYFLSTEKLVILSEYTIREIVVKQFISNSDLIDKE